MTKKRRFNFRCDQSFLDEIDDWRAEQRPVPSQSEAIRLLALRGAVIEDYLAIILENSLNDLISAGVLSDQPDPEIYRRFQKVVTLSLDQAARLHQHDRQNPTKTAPDASRQSEALEMLFRDKFAPRSRRYSR